MNIQDSELTFLDLWAVTMQWLIIAFLVISSFISSDLLDRDTVPKNR